MKSSCIFASRLCYCDFVLFVVRVVIMLNRRTGLSLPGFSQLMQSLLSCLCFEVIPNKRVSFVRFHFCFQISICMFYKYKNDYMTVVCFTHSIVVWIPLGSFRKLDLRSPKASTGFVSRYLLVIYCPPKSIIIFFCTFLVSQRYM